MPLMSKNAASYLATANQHLPHWVDANAAAPPTGIVLRGGYLIAAFTADRDALQTAINTVTQRTVERETAAEQRDLQKLALRAAHTRFRAAVLNVLQGTAWAASLPTLSSFTSNESKYLAPFQEMLNLWTTLNGLGATVPGFTAPLVLGDGTTLAAFTTALTNLRNAYRAVDAASNALKVARERRDDLLPPLRLRMQQYRNAVLNAFGPGHALVESLPRLSPLPGNTPKAVKLTGTWLRAESTGLLQWTASDEPDLTGYSVRTTGDAPYRVGDDIEVAKLPPGTLEYRTTRGLTVPGAVANFKLFVETASGNERGSNTARITRPTS